MPSIELKSFHIKNYKGIIDTKVENIPSGTQWIFLTGENGFGKTSVLQALASALVMSALKRACTMPMLSFLPFKRSEAAVPLSAPNMGDSFIRVIC